MGWHWPLHLFTLSKFVINFPRVKKMKISISFSPQRGRLDTCRLLNMAIPSYQCFSGKNTLFLPLIGDLPMIQGPWDRKGAKTYGGGKLGLSQSDKKIPKCLFQIGGTGNGTFTGSVEEGNRRKTRSEFCNQHKLLFTKHFGVSACLLKHLLLTPAVTASPSNQGIPICGEISQFLLYTSDPSLLMSSRKACNVVFDSRAREDEAAGIKN